MCIQVLDESVQAPRPPFQTMVWTKVGARRGSPHPRCHSDPEGAFYGKPS